MLYILYSIFVDLIVFVIVIIFQGCGKSVVAREFAELLGYSIEPVMLYQVNKNLVHVYTMVYVKS